MHTNTYTLSQGASFLVTMAMVLLNLLYLAPTAVRVQIEKLAMEKEVGGDECVGKVDEDKLKASKVLDSYFAVAGVKNMYIPGF